MKKQYRLIAALSALFITTSIFPVFIVKADTLPEETEVTQDTSIADEASGQEGSTALQEEISSPSPTETLLPESTASPASFPSPSPTETPLPESTVSPETSPDEIMQQKFNALETFDLSIPVEPPMFHAQIEYNFQGYVVMGTFTEFPPDVCLVQPVYSLDGETYQACGVEWNLQYLNNEGENAISKLQTQICLYPTNEPLKSYLSEMLDCFYLKLRITRENGITYDSQAILIERNNIPQPVPEEAVLHAVFASSLSVKERNPFRVYGQYQLTVSADASPDDITKLLPATLPVEVQLEKPQLDIKIGVIDCPVTWKSMSLPTLTAGESVTIADAAEEIIIPRGTLVSTPTGTFELDEPLPLDDGMSVTDEVKLILNVVSENDPPKAGLSADQAGLEIFFDLKPTGASSFQIYTLLEGASEWTALSESPIPDIINSHLSSASGYYALVLRNDQEPYQSYLAAKNAGETAISFLIGVEIEGGVYDKCQLILPWPNTYEGPLKMPIMGAGSGGNENNAGANNKSDSTAEGQRPDLPKNSAATPDAITASDTLSEVEVLYEEKQNQTKDLLPENPVASTTPAPVIQKTIADTNAEKANFTPMPSSNTEADIQEKAITVETPSLELNASATPISSIEKEKTDSHMGISRHKAIVPLFIISSASIIGIGAIGKLAVLKIYGILHK